MKKDEAIRLIDKFLDDKLNPQPNYLFFAYFFRKLSADLVVLASRYQLEGKTKAGRLLNEVAGLLHSIISKGVNMMLEFDLKNKVKRNNGEHFFAEVFLGRCSGVEGVLNSAYLYHVFNRLSQVDGITEKLKSLFVEITNKLGQVERVLQRYK